MTELDSKALDKAYAVFIKVWMKASTITALNDAVAAYLSALPAPATQEVDELRGAPLPLRNDTEGYWELVMRDVATVTGIGHTTFVEPIMRLDNREIIGFRVWDSRLKSPPELREDTARLDWLEMQMVKATSPGTFAGTVWATPGPDFDGCRRPSDLRAQIDRARLAEANKNG